jgi:hypothetical protein
MVGYDFGGWLEWWRTLGYHLPITQDFLLSAIFLLPSAMSLSLTALCQSRVAVAHPGSDLEGHLTYEFRTPLRRGSPLATPLLDYIISSVGKLHQVRWYTITLQRNYITFTTGVTLMLSQGQIDTFKDRLAASGGPLVINVTAGAVVSASVAPSFAADGSIYAVLRR